MHIIINLKHGKIEVSLES